MFDPTKPLDGAHATAAALRDQFNGLKALIDAVPAGPPGPEGPAFAAVQVQAVNTGAPGSMAAVEATMNANAVALTFTIPRGDAGEVTAQALIDERMNHAKNPHRHRAAFPHGERPADASRSARDRDALQRPARRADSAAVMWSCPSGAVPGCDSPERRRLQVVAHAALCVNPQPRSALLICASRFGGITQRAA